MRSIEGRITEDMKIDIDEKNVSAGDGFFIKSFRSLVEKTAALAYLNKDHLIFYRGQGSDHKNKSDKSSFYPSIYRGDYLPQREIEHRFDILYEASAKLVELATKVRPSGSSELKKKRLIQWSILQHYEVCGTPIIDFTQSLRVACSFALKDNTNDFAYIYVFGLPYITNRISINSEHDLVLIRLLSICPPEALRPYFQEGYLAGTSDVEHNYDSKSELDFNRRLIAKFRIPNTKEFWGKDFNSLPHNALYPKNDKFEEICKEIKIDVKRDLKPGDVGNFISLWSELEEMIAGMGDAPSDSMSFSTSLRSIRYKNVFDSYTYHNLDKLRRYRNELVHHPKRVSEKDIAPYLELLKETSTSVKHIIQTKRFSTNK
jgi:hypothetical protein